MDATRIERAGRTARHRDHGFSPAEVEAILSEQYARGDRYMGVFVILHFLIAIALAPFYETWIVTLPVATAATAMFFISAYYLPRQRWTRYIAGVSLQTFVALHIYQLHGLPEMHFFFFSAQTMMICYYDRRAFWPGTILIILQHILFAYLTNSGAQVYFYPEDYVGFTKQFFHYSIAVAQVAVCSFWAQFLRQQKLHDARMQAEAVRLSLVATRTQNAVAMTDVQGRIDWVNEGFTRITGHTREDAQGRSLVELLVGPETDPSIVTRIRQSMSTGTADEGELQVHARNGKSLWASYSLAALRDDHSRLAGFIGILSDVTHRRNLEAQLSQSKKMEAIARLAGGIAHDFNNMLTAIIGHSELMREECGQQPRLVRRVNDVLCTAGRAAGLTRQLLAYSRRQVLHPETLDVNAVVRTMAGMIRRLIGDDIVLSLDLSPDAGYVRCDPSQLDQVILNLTVNAQDAMPNGGKLTLRTFVREVQFGESGGLPLLPPGRYAAFAVADTGCGMDRETISKLFEPFFTTKPPGQGTGLGLATVQGIVEQSGGRIHVQSADGKGSTFTVFLPHAVPSEPIVTTMTAPAGASHTRKANATILLVEDESSVRDVARTLLERQGYRVLEAECGESALRILRRHDGPLDVLLTDVVMPGMSGPELAERVGALRPHARVLFMSGYPRDALSAKSFSIGTTTLLNKPFSAGELTRAVREILDSTEPATAAIRPLNEVTVSR